MNKAELIAAIRGKRVASKGGLGDCLRDHGVCTKILGECPPGSKRRPDVKNNFCYKV